MALRRTLVEVVHDDESVREWLPDLLGELGFEARAFASAEEFLVSDCLPDTGCVVLDIRLSGMSGPRAARELIRRGQRIVDAYRAGVPHYVEVEAELVHRGEEEPHRPTRVATLRREAHGRDHFQTDSSHVPSFPNPALCST